MDSQPKYAIGIDLGTTNSVLAYAKIDEGRPQIELLPVPQLVAANTVEPRSSLPSFTYLANDAESRGGAFDLPWAAERDFATGELARVRGADAPDRTVGAAKSWLCHSKVDRRAPILPWNAPESVAKISPVEASRQYLAHLVATWQSAFPDAPFSEQHVVLTIPASFDPAARELTREGGVRRWPTGRFRSARRTASRTLRVARSAKKTVGVKDCTWANRYLFATSVVGQPTSH